MTYTINIIHKRSSKVIQTINNVSKERLYRFIERNSERIESGSYYANILTDNGKRFKLTSTNK